jgi:ABC-type methionine transport system permease subunit
MNAVITGREACTLFFFAKEISNALGEVDSGTSKSLSESVIMKGIIMRSIVCSSLLRRSVN